LLAASYEEANWVCKYCVELPVKLVYESLSFYSAIRYQEGDMLVPEGSDTVLHYDKTSKLQGYFVVGLELLQICSKKALSSMSSFIYSRMVDWWCWRMVLEVEFSDCLPVTGLPFLSSEKLFSRYRNL
jgi:hypothetical protein